MTSARLSQWYARNVGPMLHEASDKNSASAIITGLSTGGGVASLLTYILRRDNIVRSVHCHVFSAPPVSCQRLSRYMEPFVRTVISELDIMPRMCFHSIENLKAEFAVSPLPPDMSDGQKVELLALQKALGGSGKEVKSLGMIKGLYTARMSFGSFRSTPQGTPDQSVHGPEFSGHGTRSRMTSLQVDTDEGISWGSSGSLLSAPRPRLCSLPLAFSEQRDPLSPLHKYGSPFKSNMSLLETKQQDWQRPTSPYLNHSADTSNHRDSPPDRSIRTDSVHSPMGDHSARSPSGMKDLPPSPPSILSSASTESHNTETSLLLTMAKKKLQLPVTVARVASEHHTKLDGVSGGSPLPTDFIRLRSCAENVWNSFRVKQSESGLPAPNPNLCVPGDLFILRPVHIQCIPTCTENNPFIALVQQRSKDGSLVRPQGLLLVPSELQGDIADVYTAWLQSAARTAKLCAVLCPGDLMCLAKRKKRAEMLSRRLSM